MTIQLERPTAALPPAPTAESALASRYRRQAGRRRTATDALTVAAWLVVSAPIALWLADGGLGDMIGNGGGGVVAGLGVLFGLLATSGVLLMLWLSARVPFIDRAIGHDRALALHSDLGQMTFLGLVMHGLFLVTGYALKDGTSWLGEFASLWGTGDFILAVVAIIGLTAVSISSVAAARAKLPHEVWHGIHLLTYASVLASLPHQFSMSSIFDDGIAFWVWAGLWASTFFAMLANRSSCPCSPASSTASGSAT